MIKITNKTVIRTGLRTSIQTVSYLATSVGDCRDGVDAMAYDLATIHGEVVTLGQVVAEPIARWGPTMTRLRNAEVTT